MVEEVEHGSGIRLRTLVIAVHELLGCLLQLDIAISRGSQKAKIKLTCRMLLFTASCELASLVKIVDLYRRGSLLTLIPYVGCAVYLEIDMVFRLVEVGV